MANLANHNVEWDDARLIAFSNASIYETEEIELVSAIGRIVAADLIAQSDLPPAHTAMMDGYAVAGAGPWKITDKVRAGQYVSEIVAGTALQVNTGAHIPADCAFVIPTEDAVIFENDVASRSPLPLGKHIRVPGDEAKAGEVILAAGAKLTPAGAGLAASSSIDQVHVFKVPYVDVLVTGDELIESGQAKPGRIRDSLSIQIPSWVTSHGAQIGQILRVKDDGQETTDAINSCQAAIIVTTGGTAHGEFDYVRHALVELGAEFLVDEINMRPGHPSVLAKLPSGQLVACLPGNPLAALVSFETLVAPALSKQLGQPLSELDTAALKEDFPADRTRIVPVKISGGKVNPTAFRGSAMLRGLVDADAFAVISAGTNPAGTQVRLIKLPW